MTEDKVYEIATGVIEPSQLSTDERNEFVNLYAKPNVCNVDTLAKVHQRAGEELKMLQEEISSLKAIESNLKTVQKNTEEALLRYCSDEINTRVTRGYTFIIKESKAAEIIDQSLIPEHYLKEKKVVEPNKALILNDLKLEKDIPGAALKINKKVSFTENETY